MSPNSAWFPAPVKVTISGEDTAEQSATEWIKFRIQTLINACEELAEDALFDDNDGRQCAVIVSTKLLRLMGIVARDKEDLGDEGRGATKL